MVVLKGGLKEGMWVRRKVTDPEAGPTKVGQPQAWTRGEGYPGIHSSVTLGAECV